MNEDLEIKLKSVVEDFLSKTLSEEEPNNMCFISSYLLSKYLNNKGFSTKLALVKINNSMPHFVVKVSNGYSIIIDGTIHQFDNAKTNLFIGTQNDYESEFSNLFFENTKLEIEKIEELNDEVKEKLFVELFSTYNIDFQIESAEQRKSLCLSNRNFDINAEAEKIFFFLRKAKSNFGIVVDTTKWDINFQPY